MSSELHADLADLIYGRLVILSDAIGADPNRLGHLANVGARLLEVALDPADPIEERIERLGTWLWPDPDSIPGGFWRTPTGEAIAQAVGFWQPVVRPLLAADILGVSRQRIYQLLGERKLTGTVGVGEGIRITTESLHDHITHLGSLIAA